jgi:hypothetical protein
VDSFLLYLLNNMTQKRIIIPNVYPTENKVLNGEFLIAQRGTTFDFATTSDPVFRPAHTLDRMIFGVQAPALNGSGERNPQTKITQESFIQGSSDIPPGNPAKYLRIKFIDAGVALNLNSYLIMNTSLDDPKSLLGQTVTLSFYAKTSIPNRRIGLRMHTQDISLTTQKEIFWKLLTTDGSSTRKWQKFVETFKIPSLVADYSQLSIIYLQLMFQCGSGVAKTWNTSAIPIAAGEIIDIADLKLEIGDRATPMPREPFVQQLLKCQQYYWEVPSYHIAHGYNQPNGTSGLASFILYFPVKMKRVPDILASNQFYVYLPYVEGTNKIYADIWQKTQDFCQFRVNTASPIRIPAGLDLRKDQGQYLKVSAD